ncbi:MAG TPA: serine/threonine-protein kinase [Luteolibacter sp.]|nr:serine/threonine-protein kinase [Luteolibacter sp.]
MSRVPEADLLAGLLPSFEFEHRIAEGASGVVFKARQLSLDREVAIKILPRELAQQPGCRRSFLAEAITMASLSHPNLLRVYDSGELDGMLYMVMEYVPGNSLLRSAHGKAIDPEQAVRIVLSACRGLAHAHAHGICHGDIRPANILLNQQCEPKISSFGLARGDTAYAAPETGNDPQTADARSDVYSIGVVLRELLTGIPAGECGAAHAVVADPRLAAICRNATEEDPADRYPDASALVGQLENWLAGGRPRLLTAPARPVGKPAIPAAKPRRATSHAWALTTKYAIIVMLLCAIHFVWGAYQAKKTGIAQMQHEQDAKPAVVKIIHPTPESTAGTAPAESAGAAMARSLMANNLE